MVQASDELTMELDSDFVEHLELVPWFVNCGNPLPVTLIATCDRASSWAIAQKSFLEAEWEDVGNESQGRLTEYLTTSHPREYQGHWNRLVEEAKRALVPIVNPAAEAVVKAHALDPIFIDCVQWDVLGAVMERSYKRFNPPLFYEDKVFLVYEAGHFPCGWVGQWPVGRLLVY